MPTHVYWAKREKILLNPGGWGGPDREDNIWRSSGMDSGCGLGPGQNFPINHLLILFINTSPILPPSCLPNLHSSACTSLASNLSHRLFCKSGLYSNVCPSERTFLFILTIVSSKLSLSHHPVSHSWSTLYLTSSFNHLSLQQWLLEKHAPILQRPYRRCEVWGYGGSYLKLFCLPLSFSAALSCFSSPSSSEHAVSILGHHSAPTNTLLIFWLVTIHPSAIVFQAWFPHYPPKNCPLPCSQIFLTAFYCWPPCQLLMARSPVKARAPVFQSTVATPMPTLIFPYDTCSTNTYCLNYSVLRI